MGKNHQTTTLDRARDELMSHVVRCNVLDARMDDRNAWLDETMVYMQERFPGLSQLELAQLELLGRQFIKPAIPHGKGNTAQNRPEATVVTEEGERIAESEAGPRSGGADDEKHEADDEETGPDASDETLDAELQPA